MSDPDYTPQAMAELTELVSELQRGLSIIQPVEPERANHDVAALLTAARDYIRLVSALEFLTRSDRRVCLVVDYRAPGEATYQTRAFAAVQVAAALGWSEP